MDNFTAIANRTPVPLGLFKDLLTIYQDAFVGKIRVIPPAAERCLEDAPEGSIMLTDHPFNQANLAVYRECIQRFVSRRDAEAMATSFQYRVAAMVRAFQQGRLNAFVRNDSKEIMSIHESLFMAARECPITSDGDFDRSLVERARKYREQFPDGVK